MARTCSVRETRSRRPGLTRPQAGMASEAPNKLTPFGQALMEEEGGRSNFLKGQPSKAANVE